MAWDYFHRPRPDCCDDADQGGSPKPCPQQVKNIERQLGDYYGCVPKDLISLDGDSSERALPALRGWIQATYLKDRQLRIAMDQVHAIQRGRPGTSCWTQYLTRCGVTPAELIASGGPKAKMFPAITTVCPHSQSVDQADMQIIDSRLHYGFSPNEFLILLIIGGFSTDAFRSQETSKVIAQTAYLGTITLAPHDTFSQRAYFDPYNGIRHLDHETERSVHSLPIRQALDLALGLIRVKDNKHMPYIILPTTLPGVIAQPLEAWRSDPKSEDLQRLRICLEQITSTSGSDLMTYSTSGLDRVASAFFRKFARDIVTKPQYREAYLIGYAIYSIEPWATLPILPLHIVQPLIDVIAPTVPAKALTVEALQARLRGPPAVPVPSGWHTVEERAKAIGSMRDPKTSFFNSSGNMCAWYYKAMMDVLKINGVVPSELRAAVAANVAATVLGVHPAELAAFRRDMMALLLRYTPPADVPLWSMDVYAGFLWGWLNNYKLHSLDWALFFQHRIFLG